MKCPKCEGKRYKEYEAGLIQIPCKECNATGEVSGWRLDQILERENKTTGDPKYLILSERMGNGETLEELADLARRIYKGSTGEAPIPTTYSLELADEINKIVPGDMIDDNTNGGTGQDDKPVGSTDTGKPSKPKKRKTRRKTTRKSS